MAEPSVPSAESDAMGDFERVMSADPGLQVRQGPEPGVRGRIEVRDDAVKNGLGQLVLAIVKLLHELLERQALRRVDAGSLSPEEVERLGTTLMMQAEEIDRLRVEFGLEEDDLNIDLGPLGRLL